MKPLRRCSLLTDTLFGPRASASLSRYALQLGLLVCLSACDSLPPLSFSELAVNEALGDLDADGYRVCPSGLSSTEQAQAGCDCDDSSPAIHPHIQELCDSIDNDCSGSPDDGPGYYAQWRDTDGDGWGNPLLERWCDQVLAGFASLSDDCNDAAKSIHPYAREFCDTIDNDCDAEADESAEFLPYFRDADNDGYGTSEETVEDCKPPLGFSALSGDCLDDNSDVHPYTLETCENGLDDNCDGYLDCPTDPAQSDPDGDGSGNDTDCDNSDDGVFPGGIEICDDKDNDCDGTVDNASEQTWYLDEDGDGWGSEEKVGEFPGCDLVGISTELGDCDDTNPATFPGAAENDSITFCMTDEDKDGYGSEASVLGIAIGTDCDDQDISTYPTAPDAANDDIDQDCRGTEDQDLVVATIGGDYASIKQAVAEALPGAYILVKPGIYYEYEISFGGKPLTLKSKDGSASTTIDGLDKGLILRFDLGEDTDTIVDGFTITNGTERYGGCIYINGGGPTIRFSVVSDCVSMVDGGALYANADTSRFEYVKFTNNTSEEDGGVMQLDNSEATFDHVSFEGNSCKDEGGVVFTYHGNPVFHNAIFRNNRTSLIEGSTSGAIEAFYSDIEIYNSVIVGNLATAGGGLSFYGPDAAGYTAILQNVLVAGNNSDYGGGVRVNDYGLVQMTNVAVVDNNEEDGISGGVIQDGANSNVIVSNSILSSNAGNEYEFHSGTYSIAYSIVAGNTSGVVLGTATTTLDPLFNNLTEDYFTTGDDYHLQLGSPGVNNGVGRDPNGSTADIGIFGGPYGDDWDLDWDGLETYWWGGSISDVPTGYNSSGFESSFLP